MKEKIKEALRTEYSGLGLSDKTLGRLADFLKGSVEKEEDIATAVKRDDVRLLATSIQGEIDGLQKAKKKAEDELADYMAKNPQKPTEDEADDQKPSPAAGISMDAISELIKKGIEEGIKPVKDAFENYKSQNSAKEAITAAKAKFYENKWTTKFKDEADEAWDRAHELNEAKGSAMTADELQGKAMEYFKKAVQRKGLDVTKSAPDSEGSEENLDFSAAAKHLEAVGKLEPQEKK